MQHWICIKVSIQYNDKYVLNDVLNGNKCSIEYVLNVLNDDLNGNICSIEYVLK